MSVIDPSRQPLSLRFWRLVALFATVALLAEWQMGANIGAVGGVGVPGADPSQDSLAFEPSELLTADAYRAYFDKPPFRQNRSPIVMVSSANALERNAQISDAELIGTILTGGSGLALFRITGEPNIIRARPGENVGEWTITLITAETVHLVRDGEDIILEIAQAQTSVRSADTNSEGENNDND